MYTARTCLAVLSYVILLSACGRSPPRDAQPSQAPPYTESAAPELPLAEPPLSREALLIDALRAASAYSSGESDAELQRHLEGKRFQFRSRFGCPAVPNPSLTRTVTFDPVKRVLKLRINPEVTQKSPVVKGLDGANVEAIEGFQIEQPWMLTTACPAAEHRVETPGSTSSAEALAPEPKASPSTRLASPAVAPRTGRTLLIAQFFTAEDPRTRRRDGRAYEATVQLSKDALPSAVGYDLVISGRLRNLPDGPVISCRGVAAEGPPACVFSAIFDRVAIEDPNTGETLAEWMSG